MRLASAARRAAAPLGRASRRYHAPVRDMRFLLHEVLKIEEHHATLTSTAECDRATVDMVVDETAKLCSEVLDPLDAVGDREGCTWVDETTVKTPAGFKEAWQLFTESGWQGLAFPEAYGGQALPVSLALVQGEIAEEVKALKEGGEEVPEFEAVAVTPKAAAGGAAEMTAVPPLMPPPPPTGRNFCSNCGARIQGSFCSQCGARA